MSIEEVKAPVLPEAISVAVLVNWQKQIGDTVQKGERLVDIDTNLFVMEVNAPQTGTVAKISKANGESVLSEEVIAQIEIGSSAVPPISKPAPKASNEPPESVAVSPKVEPTPPSLEVEPNVDSNTVNIPEPVVESNTTSTVVPDVETKSADMPTSEPVDEIPSTVETKYTDIPPPKLGEEISPSESEVESNSVPTSEPPAPKLSPITPTVKTSPAVRKIAGEQDIELSTVQRHREDRVTKEDILRHKETEKVPHVDSEPESESQATTSQPQISQEHTTKRSLRLEHSPKTIVTTFNEINMQAVIDLADKYKESFKNKYGVELSFTSFFVKASVTAIQKIPAINSSIEGDNIIHHEHYNIGITVYNSTNQEIPVLRSVDIMSLVNIEKNIGSFTKQARDSQLVEEDLTGGTFSISNHGTFGSLLSTPIPHLSQSAILGMHDIIERPIAENGQIVIRPMMYIALSYDYRLISERDAVQFLVTIKSLIEEPGRLLLEV